LTTKRLPRNVLALGLVSLATDASSDMIFPLLPMFLASLGATPAGVGLVEGAAEATAALLKLVSGRLADRARERKPLVLAGYGLSSLVRPLVAFATAAWMVLAVRVADRVGKGVRSSPRDALLADGTPPELRGRAFGFHRAMDNAGAVVGPALAMLCLGPLGLKLPMVFLLAAIPGAIAMLALLFGVRESPRDPARAPAPAPEAAIAPRTPALRVYLICLAIFALGNASDAFLLLRAAELGVPRAAIPGLWMLHNGIKALFATWGGALSDRLGRKRLLVAGWAVYGLTYLGFGEATQPWQVWALFIVYGFYYALVEGTEKALVADLAPAGRRGAAFGAYHAVVGVAALPASFGFGWLATAFGPRLPFLVAAGLAVVASLLLAVGVREPRPRIGTPNEFRV
jgi:MFS family permease